MGWGIFNKIATGVKRGYEFIKNEALPVAKKVIDVVKPFTKGTKFEKYVDKADTATEWVDSKTKQVSRVIGKKQPSMYGGDVSRYKRAQSIEPEFTIDDEDDYE